jgi:hypothetical protein
VINVKIKEPIAAGKTYVADRVTATGTQLDVGDTATKKNHGESNLVSVYRVQIDRWDVKPYAGKFEVGAGIAAGRVYIGLQTTEGKQGGVAGTFLEAGVGYLNKPPW